MQLKHIITLLLKFVSNYEVQVRSPVSRYLSAITPAKSIPMHDTFVMC